MSFECSRVEAIVKVPSSPSVPSGIRAEWSIVNIAMSEETEPTGWQQDGSHKYYCGSGGAGQYIRVKSCRHAGGVELFTSILLHPDLGSSPLSSSVRAFMRGRIRRTTNRRNYNLHHEVPQEIDFCVYLYHKFYHYQKKSEINHLLFYNYFH